MLCLVIRCVWLFVTPWTVAHQASTGKNTGLGCHFLFQGILPTQGSKRGLLHCGRLFTIWATREAPPPNRGKVCAQLLSHVWLFVTPWTVARQAPLSCPWEFPGRNTRVGCHFLLQGIFLTQGWDMSLSLLLGQADSLPLHHLRGYSIMSANFNIYISFNRFVSLLWVLFSHLFASLVIFEWMPSNERFIFLDARYFCIPIRLLLWHINLETIWYF